MVLGTSLLIITGSYRRMSNCEMFAKDVALRTHTHTDHIANLRLTDLTIKPCMEGFVEHFEGWLKPKVLEYSGQREHHRLLRETYKNKWCID